MEEKEEIIVEEKSNKKSTFGKIFNAILWIVILAWVSLCLIDFYNTRQEKEPMFCFLGKETTKYKDGKVEICSGLGYKIYNYKRNCFRGYEYGPFWFEDRSLEADACK